MRPDTDITTVYTGARPGEKLFEELNEETEGLLETCHEKIRVFEGAVHPVSDVERHLTRLRVRCRERDEREVIALVQEIVPEYSPGEELLRRSGAMDAARAGATN